MKVNRGYNPLSFKLTFYTLFALLLLRGFRWINTPGRPIAER